MTKANRFWIRETHVNVDAGGYREHEGQWEEAFEGSIQGIFRSMRTVHGRCRGKAYRDPPEPGQRQRQTVQIGWVFEKRVAYDDRPWHKYTREVWVEISTIPMVLPKPKSPWEEVG